ncbi:MAG: DUF5131 family protein [Minwuia sp.]|uniref:DUF5131 family protein n=1 Tax=Minwuia sp. TaxID=2493630 RepID=UPI003A885BC8
MAGLSEIEWTDATWNPVAGCSVLSAGCTNCYAMRMAGRLQAMGHEAYAGTTRKSGKRTVWTGQVNLIESVLDAPLRWRSPRLVFVNSMSDLFQESVPFEFVERVWGTMEKATIHTFQILTKRPERMREFLEDRPGDPLPNVWLGTSVEDARVAQRVEELSRCPAHIRFISFEPLIGSVGAINLRDIDWAIVGGESGPGSRPIDIEWADEIFEHCVADDVAFFFKQWGGPNKKKTGREYRGQTWDQMPVPVAS